MIDYFFILLIFIGVFFVLTGAMGILKFKDPYTRLHAASKGTTFGFAFIVMGAAFLSGNASDIGKALVAVIFQFSTTPIAAHMIARLAIRKGIHPVRNAKGDLMTDEELFPKGDPVDSDDGHSSLADPASNPF